MEKQFNSNYEKILANTCSVPDMERACCWGRDHPGIDIQNWDVVGCTFPVAYEVIQTIMHKKNCTLLRNKKIYYAR